MTTATYISNHTELSQERLLGQFQEKPIIQGILQAWSDKIQELEDDVYSLMTKTLFLNAEGENLQRYGTLLGIPRPDGITDGVYRELLISEILRRSSDGTPDRIRQIIEATTGMTGLRYFEHTNGIQEPFVMGAIFIFGYSDPSEVTFRVDSDEAKFIKWASPASTGSVVLGQHIYGEESLFIPSELPTESSELRVNQTSDQDDLDFLVTDTDDFLVVQQQSFKTQLESAKNSILSELGVGVENFQVEQTGTGIEDFDVDMTSGVETLSVDILGGFDNSVAVLLEISQLSLTEDSQ